MYIVHFLLISNFELKTYSFFVASLLSRIHLTDKHGNLSGASFVLKQHQSDQETNVNDSIKRKKRKKNERKK